MVNSQTSSFKLNDINLVLNTFKKHPVRKTVLKDVVLLLNRNTKPLN